MVRRWLRRLCIKYPEYAEVIGMYYGITLLLGPRVSLILLTRHLRIFCKSIIMEVKRGRESKKIPMP